MGWILYSILVALIGAIANSESKIGLLHYTTIEFVPYFLLCACIFLSIYIGINKDFTKLFFDYNSLIVGITFAIAVFLLNESIARASNPGLSMAVMRTQAILSAILSYFAFGTPLNIVKIGCMIVVLVGVYFITIGDKNHKHIKHNKQIIHNKHTHNKHHKNDKHNTQESFLNKEFHSNNSWIIFSLLSGVAFSIMDIFTKRSTMVKNNLIENIVFHKYIIATVILFIYMYITSGTIQLQSITGKSRLTIMDYLILVFCGFLSLLYGGFIAQACKLAPNVGYVKSIDCLGIPITTILSSYMLNVSISKESWIGIVIVVLGVIGLSVF